MKTVYLVDILDDPDWGNRRHMLLYRKEFILAIWSDPRELSPVAALVTGRRSKTGQIIISGVCLPISTRVVMLEKTDLDPSGIRDLPEEEVVAHRDTIQLHFREAILRAKEMDIDQPSFFYEE